MSEWIKTTASIDGSHDPDVECYTNGTTWNGWDNIALTKAGIMEWLDSSPYDYRFITNKDGNESILIYFEDEEIIDSSPLWVKDHFETVYFMDSYCFVVNG